jgi:hypothetical protein
MSTLPTSAVALPPGEALLSEALVSVVLVSVVLLPTPSVAGAVEPSPDSAPIVSFELPPHATSASKTATEEMRVAMSP